MFVQLAADNAQLIKGMNEAKDTVKHSAESMKEQVEGVKKGIEGFIAAFAIEKIAEFVHGALEAVDALRKFSAETGIAIEKLGELQFAAQKADAGEHFAMGMRHFAQVMREAQVEGSAAQAVFRSMNVDPFQTLDKGFEEIAERVSHYKDGIEKLGIVQFAFGTRNAQMVNLLNGGNEELKKQGALFRQLTGVDLEEASKKAEEFNDTLKDLKTAGHGMALVLTENLIPAITTVVQEIVAHNQSFRDGAQIIGTVLTGAIKGVVMIYEGWLGLLRVVSIAVLREAQFWVDSFKAALSVVTSVINTVTNGVIEGVNFAIRAINKLQSYLPSGGFGSIGEIKFKLNVNAPLQSELKGISDTLEIAQEDMKEKLAAQFAETAKVIEAGGKKEGEAIKKSMAPNVEDVKNLAEKLHKFMEEYAKDMASVSRETASLLGFGDEATMIGNRMEIQVAQKHIDDLRKLKDGRLALKKDELDKINAMETAYLTKQKALHQAEISLIMGTFTKMSNDMLTIGEAFGGKQSALYKTMFAASKAFAIAEATVKIMQGVAQAASQPWPLNLAAIASVVAATANIVSTIQAVKLEFGGAKAMGGPVDSGRMFLVGERGPEMFVPSGAGNIVPNNQLMGGRTTINVVNNHSDVQPEVSERQEGNERVIEILLRRVKKDVAGEIKDGKGDVARALSSTFGLRRGQTQT